MSQSEVNPAPEAIRKAHGAFGRYNFPREDEQSALNEPTATAKAAA